MKKILVIIPAYNEEANIVSAIEDIKSTVDFADIVVVNDASLDNTSLIAEELQVTVLDMPFNVGIGCAVQAGYRYAQEFGYDYAVQFDADGQHRARELLAMIEKIQGIGENRKINMVIASRFLQQRGFRSSLPRRLGIRYFSLLIFVFTGKIITDPTSGLRMVDRELIDFFSEHYAEDYPEPEAVVLALKKGFSVCEIPTFMHARKSGISSITPLKAVYYMLKVTLGILITVIGSE